MRRYDRSEARAEGAREIENDLIEHLRAPSSPEGSHYELREDFDTLLSDQPLTRNDIQSDVSDFLTKNIEGFSRLLLLKDIDISEFISKFKISNEVIGKLGANYFIRPVDGKDKLFTADEFYPEGRQLESIAYESYGDIGVSELLALAYVNANLRVDTIKEPKNGTLVPSHRYFVKSQNRYLCANDFGMRTFNEDIGSMIDGDPTNASQYIRTITNEIERIRENISVISPSLRKTVYDRLSDEDVLQNLNWLERERIIEKEIAKTISTRILTNTKERELIFNAIPPRKAFTHIHFKLGSIARKFGFLSDDAISDYQNFDTNSSNLQNLFRFPTAEEKTGIDINFIYSQFYNKPVLMGVDRTSEELNNHIDEAIYEARSGIKNILAERAAESEGNPFNEIFQKYRNFKGPESSYFYDNWKLYDLFKSIGPADVDIIFDSDSRNVSERLNAIEILKAFGYDITKMKPDQRKKQIWEVIKLSKVGIFEYLKKREIAKLDPESAEEQSRYETKFWLEQQNQTKSRDLFNEGKKMYWIAQQIWKASTGEDSSARFYRDRFGFDWSSFDLSQSDIPDEKISELIQKHMNLLTLVIKDNESIRYGDTKQPIQLSLFLKVAESGKDLRGIALAFDRNRFLNELLQRETDIGVDFAIADWPSELKSAVDPSEISIYYDNVSEYSLVNLDGLLNYAQFCLTENGIKFKSVFNKKPETKTDLDLRLCLCQQDDQILNWYLEAAEFVGNDILENYFPRFNSLISRDNMFTSLHDSLYWLSNIQRLHKNEARAILSSIRTIDENHELRQLLPRYSKELDKSSGVIESLRELKKRVAIIENSLPDDLPENVILITKAPGFDSFALKNMQRDPRFRELYSGEFDKNQPFKPYKRLFASKPLNEAIKEGLGSRSQGIKGTAKNPEKLFFNLNQLLKGRLIDGRVLKVTDLFASIPLDLEKDIIDLLQDQGVDIGQVVEAQIHAKSDPEGWVCGNYTDCCMPFGARNNNDYMFNPSTQYFTIMLNGRIIAQSVVVDSRGSDNEDVIILDNIEVAHNYKHLSPLLSNVYNIFWTEYTSLPVKIGTGYSDLIPSGAYFQKNTFKPKTRLSYSDAAKDTIYALPKLSGITSLDKVITYSNLSEGDSGTVAKMEKECYPAEMTHGIDYINEIISKQRELEVPGASSSFIIRRGNEPAGYLLLLPEESEINNGETVAHIYDLAVLPKFRGTDTARKMMERMLDIATSYNLSIEAEARASTTYALIMNERIRRWFESKGFYLTVNQKLPEYLGGEDFYLVRYENRTSSNNPLE